MKRPPIRRVPLNRMPKLVEESQDPCPHCHRSGALNPHQLSKAAVRVLMDCAHLHRLGCEWVRIEAGTKMVGEGRRKPLNTAYRAGAHAVYLTWFRLMESQGHRTGLWKVNERGHRFLRREARAPAKILCRNGATLYASDETISIEDVRGVVLDKDYWDRYPQSAFER